MSRNIFPFLCAQRKGSGQWGTDTIFQSQQTELMLWFQWLLMLTARRLPTSLPSRPEALKSQHSDGNSVKEGNALKLLSRPAVCLRQMPGPLPGPAPVRNPSTTASQTIFGFSKQPPPPPPSIYFGNHHSARLFDSPSQRY